jgi:hypothetical protein
MSLNPVIYKSDFNFNKFNKFVKFVKINNMESDSIRGKIAYEFTNKVFTKCKPFTRAKTNKIFFNKLVIKYKKTQITFSTKVLYYIWREWILSRKDWRFNRFGTNFRKYLHLKFYSIFSIDKDKIKEIEQKTIEIRRSRWISFFTILDFLYQERQIQYKAQYYELIRQEEKDSKKFEELEIAISNLEMEFDKNFELFEHYINIYVFYYTLMTQIYSSDKVNLLNDNFIDIWNIIISKIFTTREEKPEGIPIIEIDLENMESKIFFEESTESDSN